MIESTMNQTNQTHVNDNQTTNPWVESGAMVYVALTVATLSAVIMCCVWFVKHRLNNKKNKYGSVSTGEEQIELKQADQLDSGSEEENSGSEEEIDLDEDISGESAAVGDSGILPDAFTLEASDSSDDEERKESDDPTQAV
jgi:hypothetical protein